MRDAEIFPLVLGGDPPSSGIDVRVLLVVTRYAS